MDNRGTYKPRKLNSSEAFDSCGTFNSTGAKNSRTLEPAKPFTFSGAYRSDGSRTLDSVTSSSRTLDSGGSFSSGTFNNAGAFADLPRGFDTDVSGAEAGSTDRRLRKQKNLSSYRYNGHTGCLIRIYIYCLLGTCTIGPFQPYRLRVYCATGSDTILLVYTLQGNTLFYIIARRLHNSCSIRHNVLRYLLI